MHARRPSDPLSATDDRVRRFDSSSSCRDPSSGWPQLTVHAVVQLPNGDDHQSEHSRRPTLPSVATRASGQCGERTRDGARQREPGMNSGTGRPSSGGARTRGVRTFRRLREPVTLEGGVRKRSAARLRVEQPKLGGTGVRELGRAAGAAMGLAGDAVGADGSCRSVPDRLGVASAARDRIRGKRSTAGHRTPSGDVLRPDREHDAGTLVARPACPRERRIDGGDGSKRPGRLTSQCLGQGQCQWITVY
jgi:hypothetical protein